MTPSELAEKFARLEVSVAAEKGEMALFALFLREDVPDRWDLIVSAPWAFAGDRKATLDYFVNKIKADLGAADLTTVSRIVFVDPNADAVKKLNAAMNVEHGLMEVRDSNFFGLPIKHAYIITSKNLAAVGDKTPAAQ